jgi:hypothetical protein
MHTKSLVREHNIKTNLQEMGSESVNWNQLALDRVQF